MSGLHRKFTIWRNRFRDAGLHPFRGRKDFMAEDPEEEYRSFICDETDRYLAYLGAVQNADGSMTIGRNTFPLGGVPKIGWIRNIDQQIKQLPIDQLPAQYDNMYVLDGFLYTHLIGASSPVRDVKAIREHMAEMDASLDSMIQTFFFKKGSDGWYYHSDTPVFFLDAPDAYGKLFQLRNLCWKIQSQQNLDREIDGWMTGLLDAVQSRIQMLSRYWRDF